MLRDADIAMYRAKGQGKGRSAVFDTTMHAEALAHWEASRVSTILALTPLLSIAAVAGVHALWQVVSFAAETRIPVEKMALDAKGFPLIREILKVGRAGGVDRGKDGARHRRREPRHRRR